MKNVFICSALHSFVSNELGDTIIIGAADSLEAAKAICADWVCYRGHLVEEASAATWKHHGTQWQTVFNGLPPFANELDIITISQVPINELVRI